jgi:hypothetical protein
MAQFVKGTDLFHSMSPERFKERVEEYVSRDRRVLLSDAKVFAAITAMQGFDGKPILGSATEISCLRDHGYTQVFRGIHSSNDGIRADLYAEALLAGQLHPGTQTAYGHGIYLAEASRDPEKRKSGLASGFEDRSITAWEYANKAHPGVILRAVINPKARVREFEDLYADFPDYRTRALRMGIQDIGSFTAALGIDAYFTDDFDPDERIWVVLNRTVLTFQATVLQIPVDKVP